jgi:hypothetical protein
MWDFMISDIILKRCFTLRCFLNSVKFYSALKRRASTVFPALKRGTLLYLFNFEARYFLYQIVNSFAVLDGHSVDIVYR